MTKATNRDVMRGIQYYFALPLLVLAVTSTLHEYYFISRYSNVLGDIDYAATTTCSLSSSDAARENETIEPSVCALDPPLGSGSTFIDMSHENIQSTTTQFIKLWIIDSRILILGFHTKQALQHQVYESTIAAICWGICFLFIRKRCNPEFRHNYLPRFWRGTCFTMLAIFNGSLLRALVKNTMLPLEDFCTWWNRITHDSTTIDVGQRQRDFICTSQYNAIVIGVCWGIASTVVRRRLDPNMRYPTETFIRRNWKDVCCGSLAFYSSSLLKSIWKYYLPVGVVEDKLAAGVGSSISLLVGNASSSVVSNLFSATNLFIFDFETNHECYIHVHEAIRVGISWGITSLFIRKGLNPDVRDGGRFIMKYSRDTLCGMLAMSCLVFVKLAVKAWITRIVEFCFGMNCRGVCRRPVHGRGEN